MACIFIASLGSAATACAVTKLGDWLCSGRVVAQWPAYKKKKKKKKKKKGGRGAPLTSPKSKKLVTVHNESHELNTDHENWERVNFMSRKNNFN